MQHLVIIRNPVVHLSSALDVFQDYPSAVKPVSIRMFRRKGILDGVIVENLSTLGIHHENFSRIQPPLPGNLGLRYIADPCL